MRHPRRLVAQIGIAVLEQVLQRGDGGLDAACADAVEKLAGRLGKAESAVRYRERGIEQRRRDDRRVVSIRAYRLCCGADFRGDLGMRRNRVWLRLEM